jgi:hypothetical protein
LIRVSSREFYFQFILAALESIWQNAMSENGARKHPSFMLKPRRQRSPAYNLLINERLDSLVQQLSDVILPNLKSVQASQGEHIAANDRLEVAIDELRLHMNSQFAHLTVLLTACRAEVAARQALLKAVQMRAGSPTPEGDTLIH